MRKIGLVLGGGGAKGAYQVGVLKALEEAKILRHVRYVSGTSIGAINTFLLMNKLSVSTLSEIWGQFNNDVIYGKNKWSDTFSSVGLFNTDNIVNKISAYLSEKAFNQTKIKGFATLAKIPDKGFSFKLFGRKYVKEVVLLNDVNEPLKAVMASAAIPFVFGEKEFEGERYVDGGLVDNFPYEPLINFKCDTILSISLNTEDPKKAQIKEAGWIDFSPLVELGPFPKTSLDFNPLKMQIYYELGYEAGISMIKHLKRRKLVGFFGRIKRRKNIKISLADIR